MGGNGLRNPRSANPGRRPVGGPPAGDGLTPGGQSARRFRQEVGQIEPKKLVFVDETGVATAMTPAYGRALRGERVVGGSRLLGGRLR